MQIVMPMAGEGRRYIDAGFTLPKPLIDVSGQPMAVRAIGNLPTADRYIFLCRRDHIERFQIDAVLKHHLPNADIVIVDHLTEGQACTVALAGPRLALDQPVIIAACDNTHIYNKERYQETLERSDADVIVWTFRGEPRCALNPNAYGWVKTVKSDPVRIERVSCKNPVSDNPLNDHTISGFFSFRSAGFMLECICEMIRRNLRVNGEFYMDIVPNVALDMGAGAVVFETEKYIGWGTPDDLKDYRLLETFYAGIR